MLTADFQVAKDLISQLQAHPHITLFHHETNALLDSTSRVYLSLTLLVLVLVLAAFILRFKCQAAKAIPPLHPLISLLHVLTPVCSLWPHAYIRHSKPHYLQIPLKTLIEDIVAGKIEFRAPEDDIKRLLTGNGRMDVENCVLVLSVGLFLRLSVLWWWVKSTFYTRRNTIHLDPNTDFWHGQSVFEIEEVDGQPPVLCELGPRNLVHCKSSQTSVLRSIIPDAQTSHSRPTNYSSRSHSVLPALLPTLPSHILDTLAVTITLDTVSLSHLKTVLLAVPSGSLALLEFTSCDPLVSPGSTAWVLSVLSLVRATRSLRTTTLSDVLALLEGVCTVSSLQNVSAQHALLLEMHAHKLDHSAERKRFLDRLEPYENANAGRLKAWRAEKLWAYWGAACYATGGLARWVLCVRRS